MKNFSGLILIICFHTSFAQTNLRCFTMGSPSSLSEYNMIGYYMNNQPVEYNACTLTPAILIAVIDSTCIPWNTCNHNFGQINQFTPDSTCPGTGIGTCRNRAENYFIFGYNIQGQMDSLSHMLAVIPNNFNILAYTWFTDIYSNYPIFKSAFQSIGAIQITTIPDSVPYIFFIQKGHPNTLIEIIGTNSSDSLQLNTTLACNSTIDIEQINSSSFSIFPNPTTDHFIISPGFENATWTLTDVTGRLVAEGIVNAKNQIEFGKIAKANYILNLKDGKRIVKKMVAVK